MASETERLGVRVEKRLREEEEETAKQQMQRLSADLHDAMKAVEAANETLEHVNVLSTSVYLYKRLVEGNEAEINAHIKYMITKKVKIWLVPYPGYVGGTKVAKEVCNRDARLSCPGRAFVADTMMFGVVYSAEHDSDGAYTAHYKFEFVEHEHPNPSDESPREYKIKLTVVISDGHLFEERATVEYAVTSNGPGANFDSAVDTITRLAKRIPHVNQDVVPAFLASFVRIDRYLVCGHGASYDRFFLVHCFSDCSRTPTQ